MKISVGWRLLIATALGVFGLIVLTVIDLAFSSPGIFAITLIAFALSCYAAWLIFTGTKARLLTGWAVLLFSSGVLIYSIYHFHLDNNNFLLLRIIGLAIIYAILVGILRREYWRQKREQAILATQSAKFSNAVLIINPKSGDGRAIKADIPQQAKKLGIKVVVTKKSDNIERLAQDAVVSGADVLGVSGGDGTLGAVAKVAIEHDLPLVVLPGGTRCHFARDAGFKPEEISDALVSFRGVERRVDVGSINGRIFLNNVSFGLYADIVDNPEYRDNKIRTTRGVLQNLLNGTKKYYPLAFVDASNKKHRYATQILVGVNEYETANVFELGRRNHLDKGILQITAITKLTDQLIRQMVDAVIINKSFADNNIGSVYQWTAKNFKVNSPGQKLVVGVDGEREEYTNPVLIEILPKALRLMVPPEGPRQRQSGIFSPKLLKKLWKELFSK